MTDKWDEVSGQQQNHAVRGFTDHRPRNNTSYCDTKLVVAEEWKTGAKQGQSKGLCTLKHGRQRSKQTKEAREPPVPERQ